MRLATCRGPSRPARRRVRRAAGYDSPQELARAAISAAEQASQPGELAAARRRIGHETGIGQALAARLRGDTIEGLEADAVELVLAVREARGERP